MFVVCDSGRLVYLPLNAACNGSSTCTLHPSGNTSGGGQAVKVCDYHHHQPGVYVCSCTVCVRAVYPSSTSTSTCICMYTSATLPHHACVYHSIPHSHPSTPPTSPYLLPPSYIPPLSSLPHPHLSLIPPFLFPSHIPTPPPLLRPHHSTPPTSPYLPPPSYIPLFHPSCIPTPSPLPHSHPSSTPPTSPSFTPPTSAPLLHPSHIPAPPIFHPSSSSPTSPALHPSSHPHPSPHRLVPPVSQRSRSCSPTTRR